jgi:DNA invertase Pin-like site-specific DNA recombinase
VSFRATAQTSPATPIERVKVVGIVRVSTEGQAEESRAGLARQREVIRRTIAAKNLDCLEIIELHVSGTVAASHPEMLRIYGMISAGTIKGVVAADLDRIFRPDSPAGFAALQIFQDMGANIYAGDTEYDLTTANGLLHSSIRSAISGFELSLIRERMQGAKEAKRRAGKCPTNRNTLPLGIGFDRPSDTWHYTPDIARVKLLFEMFEAGNRNYSELGRRVNLGSASVKVILKNPVYTGWRVIDKKRGPKRTSASGKLYRLKVPRAANEVIRIKILDGIISEECFARVQEEMALTKFNHIERYRSNDRVNIGAGIAFCGCCGHPFFYVSGRKGQRNGFAVCKANYYLYKKTLGGCRQNHLPSGHLDDALVALTAKLLKDEGPLAAILEASAKRSKEVITPFTKAAAPSALFEDLAKRDARILDAYEDGVISLDELRAKREGIRRERSALEAASQERPKAGPSEFARMARAVIKAGHRFAELRDLREKKQVVNELFREIHVRQNQIISFRFRTMCGDDSPGSAIILPDPIHVGPVPEVLPEGQRRCIDCGEVKHVTEFYRTLNGCKPCRQKKATERRKKRRTEDGSK